jgi:hypothetical protein
MKVTRTSMVTGITRTIELPVTQEQIDVYHTGMGLLQDVFPNLTSGEREFIKSGITAEEWDLVFPESHE